MTLRQKLVIKDVAEGIKNPSQKKVVISEIMRKNGYAESSCVGGATRKFIQDYTKRLDFFDPEKIKKDIKQNRKEARKAEDYAVVKEIDYHRIKVAGMIIDKAEVAQTDIPDNQFSLNRLAQLKLGNDTIPQSNDNKEVKQ